MKKYFFKSIALKLVAVAVLAVAAYSASVGDPPIQCPAGMEECHGYCVYNCAN